MASTTIGVKIDDGLRTRLKTAAEAMGRSPHWLIKQSILSVLERIERGDGVDDLLVDRRAGAESDTERQHRWCTTISRTPSCIIYSGTPDAVNV